MKINFKPDFIFGASFSGPQTEGYEGKVNDSNWDYWFKNDKTKFYETTGPSHLHELVKTKSDYVKMMKAQKLNSIRTSIQWSRIIKNFETGEVHQEGIEFYKQYFSEIKNEGIKVHACLHHFDMPRELELHGGWLSKQVLEKFVGFSKICFENFGDLVDLWIVFNEPLVIVDSAYVWGYHQPLINDFKLSMQAAVNIMYVTACVIAEYKKTSLSSKIGIAANLTPAYPFDSKNPLDQKAVELEHIITNNIFLYPALKGEIQKEFLELMNDGGIELEIPDEYVTTIKENVCTFLGVNYYAPVRLKGKDYSGTPKGRDHYFEQVVHPESRFNNHRGWEIYGKGIYDIANWIKKDFNNIDWMVQENGLGIGSEENFIKNDVVQDSYRIDFYKEHLYWLDKAIREGANCFGYHVWTFVDNWSWLNAFKNRYGLWRFDLKTNKITQKLSGYWYENVAVSKVLEFSDIEINQYELHPKKFK